MRSAQAIATACCFSRVPCIVEMSLPSLLALLEDACLVAGSVAAGGIFGEWESLPAWRAVEEADVLLVPPCPRLGRAAPF